MTRLYLIKGHHPSLYWKTKIGITGDLKERRGGISRSMGVSIHYVTSRPLLFARAYEKALHWIFAPLRSPAWGNGGTEWFICVRWLSFGLIWLLWLLETAAIMAAVVFLSIGIFATITN